tara:strand:- start:5568 stop:6083 length:516 start_codon:yes stop_codon:yes gene_type:complete
MTIIWFNGPSNRQLIHSLPRQTFELGCNFIRRHRPVDVVCAYDINTIIKIPIEDSVQYYTRPDAQYGSWNVINDPVIQSTNSGLLACYVASRKTTAPIYIVGCDWGITRQSNFEHLYDHTEPKRKYIQPHNDFVKRVFAGKQVWVVHDQQPDIDLPVVSVKQFKEQLEINI